VGPEMEKDYDSYSRNRYSGCARIRIRALREELSSIVDCFRVSTIGSPDFLVSTTPIQPF